jgi:hypothetical protein
VTAAIFESLYGHELRVFYDGDQNNIVSTKVSRTDDGPLEQRSGSHSNHARGSRLASSVIYAQIQSATSQAT